MNNYLNFIEGLFGIFAGIYFAFYLTGKLNYSGEKEERRKARVQKYGWLLGICTIVIFICSLLLILGSF